MALVHLTSVAQSLAEPTASQLSSYHLLRRSAELSIAAAADTGVRPAHGITDDPHEAELILFCEPHTDDAACGRYLQHLRTTPLYRQFTQRCYVHCGLDKPPVFVPGIYPSLDARWHDPRWTRGGSYLTFLNPHIDAVLEQPPAKRYLASFVGSATTHPVRKRLLELHDGHKLFIEDRSRPFVDAHRAQDWDRVGELKRQYVEIAAASQFGLCPRGAGAGSIRLFEMMKLGIAPVIIADAWVPPEGPDWDAFSIRVNERQLAWLPEILAERQADAKAMGQQARVAFERHFGKPAIFGTVVDAVESIRQQRLSLQAGRFKAWVSLGQEVPRYYMGQVKRRLAASF